MIRFVVMEDGTVGNVTVMHAVSKGLDDESVRVVKMLPAFTPGRQQGKPVRVYFNLPIVYKLTGGDNFSIGIENLAQYDKNFNAGLTAMRNRDFVTAIKQFAKLAKKYNNGNIYNLLWVCYKETGDTVHMCEALKKAIRLGNSDERSSLERLCK